MKKVLTLLAALIALATAAPAVAATFTVKIEKTAFVPATLTIQHGDSVTWKNLDVADHQVVANDGSFATPILKPGQSASITFSRAGTFRYHDAYRTTLSGTITAKGPPPSLSFVLDQPIVTYGTQITLTAQVSSHLAGESVSVLAQPYGQPQTTLVTLTTGASGIASFQTTPALYTSYVARWKSIQSGALVVQVRPSILLLPYDQGRFITKVIGAKSFGGQVVYLQRLSAFGQWVSIRRLALGPRSGRVFAYPRLSGTHLYRIYISTNQAGLGYLESWSGTQRVRIR